jgi:hypothetical protein
MSGGGRDLPAKLPLDRSALERVLARAAELQSTDGDADEPGLTDAQLVEIAKEVGLAPANLKQALAEERSRMPVHQDAGLSAAIFGAAGATAERTIAGRPEEHLAALEMLMQQEEGLAVRRRVGARTTWERAPGLIANLSRTFDLGGRGYHLTRADDVTVSVVPVDDSRTLVRLDASVASARTRTLEGLAVLLAILIASAGIGIWGLGIAPWAAAIAVLPYTVLGFLFARNHRRTVARAQLSLEQVLDRLERRDPPRPSLLGAITALPRKR